MEDRVITQTPTQAHTAPQAAPGTPIRPEAAYLGELTMAACQRAIQGGRLAIAAGYGRRADASDLPRLEQAGMAAWETAILEVLQDKTASQALATLAAQAWLMGRAMMAPQVTAMAKALIGASL